MQTMSLVRIALVAAVAGGFAQGARAVTLTGVPSADTKVVGIARPNALSQELAEVVAAQGSTPLENPTPAIPFYGYDGDGPMLPAPGDVQTPQHDVEATKTEPDKNTYLVLDHATGADPSYDYGHHFLFQGHENGAPDASGASQGFISRINLDADAAHRVTLLADHDASGAPIAPIDGSTWDPFAERLLFTTEDPSAPGVYQATLDVPSTVEDLSGSMGRGGYEGIQNDFLGNLYIVEDVGGPLGTANPHARQPNSFVYRFVPAHPNDLTRGKLQVLQVMSLANPGQPIAFHAGQPDADILSQDVHDLHTYGKKFQARFVTIHDTAVDGDAPFSANALAKAAGGTPFKRPENGQFRPGTLFTQFFFDETGDTDTRSEAGSDFGGFGGIMKLTLSRAGGDTGTLSLFYLGDATHTGLDNVSFLSPTQVVFVEDAGDGLHSQRDAFDSAWVFDVRVDYSSPAAAPLRMLALGRDPSATLDSGLSAAGGGFQNEGDNEITGFHVSNGDPGVGGILGARLPVPFTDGWRVFYTQQHGDNTTWEIVPSRPTPPVGPSR